MRTGLILALAWGCAGILEAAEADEIMAHSVKLADANWSEAPNYSYVRSEANSEGGAQPTRKTYEVLMIEGSPYLKMIAEEGRELSPLAVREEEQKYQREIEKRRRESPRERQKRIAKFAEERDRDHAFLSEIPVAFVFRMLNQPPPEKDAVWLLEGTPKPGYTPSTREGKVLAGMNVKFWIDKATCQWLRIEAEVQHPVSIYGLFAKVGPGTKFTLEQAPVAAGIWLPKHFTVHVDATALGIFKKDSVQDETYSNYRPIRGVEAANARAVSVSVSGGQ
jgi:hypothetical protein